MAYQRKPPYHTVAYELSEEEWKRGDVTGKHMEGIEHTGLRKVDISGFHVSAMRMSVTPPSPMSGDGMAAPMAVAATGTLRFTTEPGMAVQA